MVLLWWTKLIESIYMRLQGVQKKQWLFCMWEASAHGLVNRALQTGHLEIGLVTLCMCDVFMFKFKKIESQNLHLKL